MKEREQTMIEPVHPGNVLANFAKNRQLNANAVAEKSNLDIKVIRKILAGSGDVTPEISEKLGNALELGKGFFSSMQTIYEENIADMSEDLDQYEFEDIEKIDGVDKCSVILSALSAGIFGTIYNSVHIQKLLFLINEKLLSKKLFDFQPFKYGPFDKGIQISIRNLAQDGLMKITHTKKKNRRYENYILEFSGHERGREILNRYPDSAKKSIQGISNFIVRRDYMDIIPLIYDEYPEMKVNSEWKSIEKKMDKKGI